MQKSVALSFTFNFISIRIFLCNICLFYLVPFLSHAVLVAQENPSHLRAINYLYMHIDTTLAAEVTSTERLDLSEIMELNCVVVILSYAHI